jgi:F-type H+-transporting ATPase subunit a
MHGVVLAANPGFEAPGTNDFLFGVSNHLLWKSSLLLVLAALVVLAFFLATSRKAGVVPTKLQYAGESAYGWVRDSIGRDVIGEHDFLKFVPLLVTVFFFILANNLFGLVPLLQFAPFSRVGFAYGMAAMVWFVYNGVGIGRHGFGGYLKLQTVPAGVPGWILPLLIPLEFLSNILIRPITLSLRLFANMFAGHLLIILFATGASYLLFHAEGSFILKPAGVLSFVLGIAVGFLEFIVEILQAYVFVLLTATYISGALASEH